MRKREGYIVAGLLVVLQACAAPEPEPPQFDAAAIEAEVAAWVEGFWATWNEGGKGFDRAVSLFHDKADFVVVSEGNIWTSYAGWVEELRPAVQSIDHQSHEMRETRITVLSPNLAYVAQRGDWTGVLMDGTNSDTTTFAQTMLLERGAEGWKVRFLHESF